MDVALWATEADAADAASHCLTMPEFVACKPYMTEDLGIEHGAVVATY